MKRRNEIKVGLESTQRKPKRENKVILHVRIKPELQEFIDSSFNNGDFKTKTAVVESSLEFLRNYMAAKNSLESSSVMPLASLLDAPSDSA